MFVMHLDKKIYWNGRQCICMVGNKNYWKWITEFTKTIVTFSSWALPSESWSIIFRKIYIKCLEEHLEFSMASIYIITSMFFGAWNVLRGVRNMIVKNADHEWTLQEKK